MHINDLSDDCLDLIFSKLKLRDQVSFMHISQRFYRIFERRCKRDYEILNLDETVGMSACDLYEFLNVAGPTINTLLRKRPINRNNRINIDDTLKLVSHFCPNVRMITLSCITNTGGLGRIIKRIRNITDLQLDDCALKNCDVLEFKKLRKLKKLTLLKNNFMTNKYLYKLSNLHELKYQNCYVESIYLVKVFQSLTELHKLTILNCGGLQSTDFFAMQEHCHKLESLVMSDIVGLSYDCIARLPALKRLTFSTIWRETPEIFAALAMHKSTQLEYLEIRGSTFISLENASYISRLSKLKQLLCLSKNVNLNDDCLQEFCKLQQLEEISLRNCSSITNVGLLNLVRQCQKLKSVDVQHCPNITDQFVFDVIEFLRQQQEKPQTKEKRNQITFYVYNTGISELIIKNAKCENIKSLLNLSFNQNNQDFSNENYIIINIDYWANFYHRFWSL